MKYVYFADSPIFKDNIYRVGCFNGNKERLVRYLSGFYVDPDVVRVYELSTQEVVELWEHLNPHMNSKFYIGSIEDVDHIVSLIHPLNEERELDIDHMINEKDETEHHSSLIGWYMYCCFMIILFTVLFWRIFVDPSQKMYVNHQMCSVLGGHCDLWKSVEQWMSL